MIRTLNFTPKFIDYKLLDNFSQQGIIIHDFLVPYQVSNIPNIDYAFIKLNTIGSYNFYAPIIKDDLVEYNFWTIPFHLAMFCFVTMIIKKCSEYFKFNPQTWSPLAIFGMVLGGDNARTPTFIAERVFFIFVFMAGFLFGGELTCGLVITTALQVLKRGNSTATVTSRGLTWQ